MGIIKSNTLSSGVKTTSAAAIANNFWTFEPDLALTYLEDGWNLTLHALFDFNTKKHHDQLPIRRRLLFRLHRGQVLRQRTVGAGGKISQQFNSDVSRGAVVNGNGHRFQQILLWPYAGYDFRPGLVEREDPAERPRGEWRMGSAPRNITGVSRSRSKHRQRQVALGVPNATFLERRR
jgi:Putative MetA-pathway of phenol degradation